MFTVREANSSDFPSFYKVLQDIDKRKIEGFGLNPEEIIYKKCCSGNILISEEEPVILFGIDKANIADLGFLFLYNTIYLQKHIKKAIKVMKSFIERELDGKYCVIACYIDLKNVSMFRLVKILGGEIKEDFIYNTRQEKLNLVLFEWKNINGKHNKHNSEDGAK